MAVAATAVLVPASPAQADATGCASNVCIYLAGNAGGTALIQGWARNSDFDGYFTVSGPDGVFVTGGNGHWMGGKGNYWSTSIPNAGAGTYCVTGNPGQGTACESLS